MIHGKPKWIIENGKLKYNIVRYARFLAEDESDTSNVVCGGWFTYINNGEDLLLYRGSADFGQKPTGEVIALISNDESLVGINIYHSVEYYFDLALKNNIQIRKSIYSIKQ